MLYYAWIAKHHGMWRYIDVYETIGSYQHIIAYRHFSHYCRIDANPHPIAYRGVTFARATVHLPDNHALVNVAVAPNFCSTIYSDIIGMTYINTPPQLAGSPSVQDLYDLPKCETAPCSKSALVQMWQLLLCDKGSETLSYTPLPYRHIGRYRHDTVL